MIRVSLAGIGFGPGGVKLPEAGGGVTLTVSGHGSGVRGSDPVCAGVSILAHTLAAGIHRLAGVQQQVAEGAGHLETVFPAPGDEKARERLTVILDLFMIGILEIEREHAGSIQIIHGQAES